MLPENDSKLVAKSICSNLVLVTENIPILPNTYKLFESLYKIKELDQEIEDISDAILDDPFLSLKVLIFLGEARKNSSVVIDSMRKIVMLMGMKKVFDIALSSSVLMVQPGLEDALWRARFAAEKAGRISEWRRDIAPDEVRLSTLLADLGELILWIFKPEIPSKVRDAMLSGEYRNNSAAQLAVGGFYFKDLSLELTKYFHFPETLSDLLTDKTLIRSKIARECINLARHIKNKQPIEVILEDVKKLLDILDWNKEDLINVLNINFDLNASDFEFIVQNIGKEENK